MSSRTPASQGRVQQTQSFSVVVQFLVMPMFLLSGAIFPLSRLPGWPAAPMTLNPFTYAVDPMRQASQVCTGDRGRCRRELNCWPYSFFGLAIFIDAVRQFPPQARARLAPSRTAS
jgi:ABC-type polysaccharide/polyol phosphate export permease